MTLSWVVPRIVALQLMPSQFLYINSSFSPAPDDTVANLFQVSTAHCCTVL